MDTEINGELQVNGAPIPSGATGGSFLSKAACPAKETTPSYQQGNDSDSYHRHHATTGPFLSSVTKNQGRQKGHFEN